jgi:hypothetical protein
MFNLRATAQRELRGPECYINPTGRVPCLISVDVIDVKKLYRNNTIRVSIPNGGMVVCRSFHPGRFRTVKDSAE